MLEELSSIHVQVIVSRKDITDSIRLSPLNNSRGKNVEHSLKVGQFDRVAFKQKPKKNSTRPLIMTENYGKRSGMPTS
jgi:hypothetical protein